MKKIMFVGGGTLGHIYPAIPVIRCLKQKDSNMQIYFVGTESGLEKDVISKVNEITECFYQKSQGFKRKLSLYNVKTVFQYIKNYYETKKILKKIKPDLVIGMGGYVSGAALKAAISLKIKTMIHEQNSVFGMTNNLLKHKVNKILTSYPLEEELENMVYVGNPRTTEYYNTYRHFLNKEKPNHILVVGGSRGAKRINETILELKEWFIKNHIYVTLITGKKYYSEHKFKIQQYECEYLKIKEFVSNLAEELIENQIIITRCGATTLSEITALNKVAILVPSPNVTNQHQEKNGNFFVSHGAAVMIIEKEFTRSKLMSQILFLLNNKVEFMKIKQNLHQLTIKNAADRFIVEIEHILKTEDVH